MSSPRTLIVGDVHGCADELDDLLRLVDLGRDDRLIFVGDMVAKGPDSAGVLARARERSARAVLGNHEMPILAYHDAIDRREAPPKMKETHRRTAESLGTDDVAWLRALPYYLRLPEHGVVVTHAGLVPGVALEDQSVDAMLTMRNLRADGSWTKDADVGTPWASHWRGPEHVVFGHDAMRKLQRHPFATGLDTGCVYGGELTALELPSRAMHRVRAHREWRAI